MDTPRKDKSPEKTADTNKKATDGRNMSRSAKSPKKKEIDDIFADEDDLPGRNF